MNFLSAVPAFASFGACDSACAYPARGSGGRRSYASYAIVGAAPVDAWKEQGADQLQALAARQMMGQMDVR